MRSKKHPLGGRPRTRRFPRRTPPRGFARPAPTTRRRRAASVFSFFLPWRRHCRYPPFAPDAPRARLRSQGRARRGARPSRRPTGVRPPRGTRPRRLRRANTPPRPRVGSFRRARLGASTRWRAFGRRIFRARRFPRSRFPRSRFPRSRLPRRNTKSTARISRSHLRRRRRRGPRDASSRDDRPRLGCRADAQRLSRHACRRPRTGSAPLFARRGPPRASRTRTCLDASRIAPGARTRATPPCHQHG